MKKYNTNQIRNVCLIGHGGSGKTTLSEALLYISKSTDRLGKVIDGTTISDFENEEIKRNSSVSLSVLPFEYEDTKINLIDVPGQLDFEIELKEALLIADSVIIVISGKSGVTVGAKKAYKEAKDAKIPITFFVTKLDSEYADFYKVLEELKSEIGPSICPITVPSYKDDKVECIVDLVYKKAYKYNSLNKIEIKMPNLEHRLQGLETAISEAVAQTNEKLFDKYFSGDQFTDEEKINGIENGILTGSVVPVLCGSGDKLEGVDLLLNAIKNLLPTAHDEAIKLECTDDFVGKIFKTSVDPFYGKLSYIRVYSGTLKSGDVVKNNKTNETEKIGKLIKVTGKNQEDTEEIIAGDIGAITKSSLKTNYQIYKKSPKHLKELELIIPTYNKAIKTQKDESKVSSVINKLLEEDPSLTFETNSETRQQILSGLSNQHLEVVASKLKEKFGVIIEFEEIKIPYRETIRKKVKAHGRYKKQTGGHGQFAEVYMEFEPSPSDGLEFVEKIYGGAVPKNYFPAVQKGFEESAECGLLAGFKLVGVKAILVDGSYHPVDSSEMAFKIAANICYKEGIANASPTLLEPIYKIKIKIPETNTGDIMGELNKKRVRVLGMEPSENDEKTITISAQIPQSEMLDFNNIIRQITQGIGTFTTEFLRYEQLPEILHSEVIAKNLNNK